MLISSFTVDETEAKRNEVIISSKAELLVSLHAQVLKQLLGIIL